MSVEPKEPVMTGSLLNVQNEENMDENSSELSHTKTILYDQNQDENNNNDNEEANEDYNNYGDDYADDYYDDNDLDDDDLDSDNEDDLYCNDPEHFDYESYPIEKLDWIVEKKCEKVYSYLNLNDPLDAVYILKQFTWNLQKLIEAYDHDKQEFLKTYFSDKNNNNSKTIQSIGDKSKYISFVNIFSEESDGFFANVKPVSSFSDNQTGKSIHH
jgi:hypothetical protein